MKPIKEIDFSQLSFETKRDLNFYIKDKFQDPAELTQNQINEIKKVVKLLEDDFPRDYLIGNSEFYGRKFYVDQSVLIPRAETEILIDVVKNLNLPDNSILCDIGTGSGCIGITLALMNKSFIVFGVDISENAIEVAKKNSLSNKENNFFLVQSNWASCFLENSINCIVSNPPYIDKNDPHLEDLQHEPPLALISESYGLQAFEVISKQAKKLLKDGGFLLLEHGYDQSKQLEQIINKNDLKLIKKVKDLSGNDRAMLAQK